MLRKPLLARFWQRIQDANVPVMAKGYGLRETAIAGQSGFAHDPTLCFAQLSRDRWSERVIRLRVVEGRNVFCPFRSFLVAGENIRFSSLFAAGDVSRGGRSATQRQKFHTDDANQCLHNESGSHGVPNINLSNFACLLAILVKCCVHLPTSSSKTQMLPLEKTIFQKY